MVDGRLRRAGLSSDAAGVGVFDFLATVGTAVNLAFTTAMAYALANRHLLEPVGPLPDRLFPISSQFAIRHVACRVGNTGGLA
ncbi:MAG: hypothetical protein ACRDJH_18705 [Thermomicrobiales bacterium]